MNGDNTTDTRKWKYPDLLEMWIKSVKLSSFYTTHFAAVIKSNSDKILEAVPSSQNFISGANIWEEEIWTCIMKAVLRGS